MPFKLVVRTYTAVLNADIVKKTGQTDIAWIAGLDNALAERVVSRPTTGLKQVHNLMWDPGKEELIVEVSETAES